LRQSLVFLNVPTMQQPEIYLGGADKLFGADGTLTGDSVSRLLQKFLTAFADWVERNAKS
jgi:chromate reductase